MRDKDKPAYVATDNDLPKELWPEAKGEQQRNRFQELRELVIRQAESLALYITPREVTLCAVIMYGIEDDKKHNRGGNVDGEPKKE
jgi:hypothetical protein